MKKRILITGAAGSIGSELVRQLVPFHKIYCLDNNESGLFDVLEENKERGWCFGRVGDIRNEQTIADVFSDFKPEIIYHAAALKHVPLMESQPREAIDTNVLGTLNLIQHAKKWECFQKFVFISTDKAVQSHSIMGASKRMSEIIVKNQGKGFVVVRFGNVLGSRGSLIPIWERQIKEKKPITITDERMERYMMTIEEAVNLVIKASEMGVGGEIICLDMGKKVNILQFAKEVLSKAGVPPEIRIIGLRAGEALTEELMFAEEKLVAVKKDNFYIIS